MKNRWMIAMALLLSSSIGFAQEICSSDEILTFEFTSGSTAQLRWDQPPEVNVESFAELIFFDQMGLPINLDPDVQPEVILWMNMPNGGGHGSLPTTTTKKSCGGVGCYQVSNVWFYMPGIWQITLNLRRASLSPESSVQLIEIRELNEGGGSEENGHHHH